MVLVGLDKCIIYEMKPRAQIWCLNKRVSQMRAPLAVRREPAGVQDSQPNRIYGFEHKT